jgi:methionyl-tRNA synthetase
MFPVGAPVYLEVPMTAERTYITTTIPYVNARPHVGHALEFVQADVLARHRRRRGDEVRFQTGTDDNSLTNVLAAEAAGVGVQEFVDANAATFAALTGSLALSADDTIHTSRDPRHRVGVERLWQACAASDDLYRRHYAGLYCVRCEQFYTPAELAGGRCPDHGTEPQRVREENWFFRLSRYTERLHDLISTGELRIEPAEHRNEVLAFIAGGLADFSVSRSTERARGWGIPVPGDPGQVIYVWWDALGNYLTALGYGTGSSDKQRWWDGAQRRVHLVGKGVVRFHAVYWPAILLSANEPLPTDIYVHGYLTAGGRKISKSSGISPDPAALARSHGADALRWWLLREVPRVGDADFTDGRLVNRANDELANGLGNLVNRVVALVHRYRDGRVPTEGAAAAAAHGAPGVGAPGPKAAATEALEGGATAPEAAARVPLAGAGGLVTASREAPGRIDAALADFNFREATSALWRVVDEANRFVNQVRPWDLAKAERAGDAGAGAGLDAVLALLVHTCQQVADWLAPFLPDAATRLTRQCTAQDGQLPAPTPVFQRLTVTEGRQTSGGTQAAGTQTSGGTQAAGRQTSGATQAAGTQGAAAHAARAKTAGAQAARPEAARPEAATSAAAAGPADAEPGVSHGPGEPMARR